MRMLIPRLYGQQGWIAVELVLSLVLLSVVLVMVQNQMTSQWQVVQQENETHLGQENRRKQEVMSHLTGDASWLDLEKERVVHFPNCSSCSGEDFRTWFLAALYERREAAESLELENE